MKRCLRAWQPASHDCYERDGRWRAARHDKKLDPHQTSIQEHLGLLGLEEVPAGYTDVRYVVSLTSPASTEDIIRVLDTAEVHSPYMDVFRRPHALRRSVRIATPEEETP